MIKTVTFELEIIGLQLIFQSTQLDARRFRLTQMYLT